MTENEAMLKRLQSRGSVYNVTDWEVDRKKQVKDIKRISKYGLSISTQPTRRRKRANKNYATEDLNDLQAKAWHESKYKGPNKEIFEQLAYSKIS